MRYRPSALPTEFSLHTSCLLTPAHVLTVVYSVPVSLATATFLFLQLMHMNDECRIFANTDKAPAMRYGITTSPPRQSTAVLLPFAGVALGTQATYLPKLGTYSGKLVNAPFPSFFRLQRVNSLTNRFHVAVRLFSNRSQMTSKWGKTKKWHILTSSVIYC